MYAFCFCNLYVKTGGFKLKSKTNKGMNGSYQGFCFQWYLSKLHLYQNIFES